MIPRWRTFYRQRPILTQGIVVAMAIGLYTVLARVLGLSDDAGRSWASAGAFGLLMVTVSIMPNILAPDARQRGIPFRAGLVTAAMLAYAAALLSLLADDHDLNWKKAVAATFFAALAAATFVWSYRARERPEQLGPVIVEVSPLHERMRARRGG